MKHINILTYIPYVFFVGLLIFAGCSDNSVNSVPEEENEVEVITDLKLIFTNVEDGSDVVEANAQDPDGEGVEELAVLDDINLDVSKTYTLTFEIFNNLDTPGEDIGEEVEEEDNEHQFFFSFTDGAFANPSGNGNIDNASDQLNYNDEDENGLPVGLSTEWTTSSTPLSDGEFTVRLNHQPDIKAANTGADDGDVDIDVSFVLNIQIQ